MRFPSFDHAVKDPVEDSVEVGEEIKHVIVEGIYVFDKKLGLENTWDVKVWVEVGRDEAI